MTDSQSHIHWQTQWLPDWATGCDYQYQYEYDTNYYEWYDIIDMSESVTVRHSLSHWLSQWLTVTDSDTLTLSESLSHTV